MNRTLTKNHKPVLVITRALPGMCGACDYYSKFVDAQFKELLKKDSRVDVLELTKEPTEITVTNNHKIKVHPDIYSWVTWWPSFIIFTANSWNDHNSSLQGAIFGGIIDEETGTPAEAPGKYDYRSPQMLIEWVENTLNSNLFLQRNKGFRKYEEYQQVCDPRYGWCMNGKITTPN